jgi:hypothetical protein
VRNQQRQTLGDALGQVFMGEDGHQAVDVEGVGHVDVEYAGVREWAAHERGGQRTVAEVIQVPTLTAQQARVLPARDPLPDHLCRHGVRPSRPAADADSSAARSTAATMFW